MSEGLNRVILLGNLGSDPELRYTQGGTAVLNMSLATNESFLDRNKERQERTDWHRVVVWGARAEGLAKILAKGACVLVEGGLRTSSFEKDGLKRSRTEVHAREICLTGRPPSVVPEAVREMDEPFEPEAASVVRAAGGGGGGGGGASTVAARRAVARAPAREESPSEDDLPY